MPHRLLLCFLLFLPLWAKSQLQITYPANRIVYQRDAGNAATFTVAGTYTGQLDRVEARFVPVQGGVATGWRLLQANPVGGSFSGSATVSGGWYSLEVRGLLNGNPVATATLERVGVGEVFLIMGHSNGAGDEKHLHGATDDRVTIADSRKSNLTAYLEKGEPAFLSKLDFVQFCRECKMAPFDTPTWIWSYLGDLLVRKLNVPVLFYNAAFGGTNMEQNYKAIKRIPFEHSFVNYRIGMPYVNVKNSLWRYVPTTGLRAVLAVHGENDVDNAEADIVNYYQTTIEQSRIDANAPTLPWMVAISSFKKSRVSGLGEPHPHVRRAQETVILNGVNVFRGPDLDQVNSPLDRPDTLHYSSESGQVNVAALWNEALTDDFFRNTPPLLPIAPPVPSAFCNDGTRLTLSLPSAYASFSWNGAGDTPSITPAPGTYSATVRDALGRFWFTPAVQVPANPGPPRPTVAALGKTTFCEESGGVTLVAAGNPLDSTYRWSTGQNSRALRVNQTGEFTVRAYNRLGCFSEPSAVLRTTQAPVPDGPTLDKTGPFTLRAAPRAASVGYDWQADNGPVVGNGSEFFKTSTSAAYRARAYTPLTLNGENLVCRSAWSPPYRVDLSGFADEEFIVFPTPSPDGFVTLDSRLVWENLDVSVITGDGRVIFQQTYPTFDGRLRLYLGPTGGKFYIHVRGQNLSRTKTALVP